jgi:hypothetical protein
MCVCVRYIKIYKDIYIKIYIKRYIYIYRRMNIHTRIYIYMHTHKDMCKDKAQADVEIHAR